MNLVFLVSGADSSISSKEDLGGSTSTEVTVVTVEGGRADLPCDIEAKSKDDSVYLVLWYRKNSGTPIYRYDHSNHYLQHPYLVHTYISMALKNGLGLTLEEFKRIQIVL